MQAASLTFSAVTAVVFLAGLVGNHDFEKDREATALFAEISRDRSEIKAVLSSPSPTYKLPTGATVSGFNYIQFLQSDVLSAQAKLALHTTAFLHIVPDLDKTPVLAWLLLFGGGAVFPYALAMLFAWCRGLWRIHSDLDEPVFMSRFYYYVTSHFFWPQLIFYCSIISYFICAKDGVFADDNSVRRDIPVAFQAWGWTSNVASIISPLWLVLLFVVTCGPLCGLLGVNNRYGWFKLAGFWSTAYVLSGAVSYLAGLAVFCSYLVYNDLQGALQARWVVP